MVKKVHSAQPVPRNRIWRIKWIFLVRRFPFPNHFTIVAYFFTAITPSVPETRLIRVAQRERQAGSKILSGRLSLKRCHKHAAISLALNNDRRPKTKLLSLSSPLPL